MKLSDLLIYDNIVIQCHDNPDADTIASGYALYLYYLSRNIQVKLIYAGNNEIGKSNLKKMVRELNIPIEKVTYLDRIPEVLITVDSQYEEGNVTRFEANKIAVIDHHQDCHGYRDYKEIQETYGSCATLVYCMLLDEDYPVNDNVNLMTALYYGLYMDTNGFSEIKHALDRDMYETLKPDESVIITLKNCVFTFQELEIAGMALLRYSYNETNRFAVVRVNECDPNLLGFISDLLLQVEDVDTSLSYCAYEYGYKFSVRNCNPEVTSNEIVSYLVQDMGTGGGHLNKAGGYVIRTRFEKSYAGMDFLGYLLNRLKEYFMNYEIVEPNSENIKIEKMQLYERVPIISGVCKSTDIGTQGKVITIRTITKDVVITISEDTYILMNIQGEVKAIDRLWFLENFEYMKAGYHCNLDYKPKVHIHDCPQIFSLSDYMKCCISTNKSNIYARQLNKVTKLYINRKQHQYELGSIGDYLVVDKGMKEVSIIKKDIFQDAYQIVN